MTYFSKKRLLSLDVATAITVYEMITEREDLDALVSQPCEVGLEAPSSDMQAKVDSSVPILETEIEFISPSTWMEAEDFCDSGYLTATYKFEMQDSTPLPDFFTYNSNRLNRGLRIGYNEESVKGTFDMKLVVSNGKDEYEDLFTLTILE